MTDRIPYGEESEYRMSYLLGDGFDGGDDMALYLPRDAARCPDCQVDRGQLHKIGCDVEQCPKCHRQLIGCDCEAEEKWT